MRKPISRRQLFKAALAAVGGAAASRFFGPGLGRARASGGDCNLPWPKAQQILADTQVPTFPDVYFDVTDPLYERSVTA